jgi:hypothetical protein
VLAFLDVSPRILAAEVSPEEYARLLQMPRHRPLEGDLALRAAGARAWYEANGRPWAAARRVDLVAVEDDRVIASGGPVLTSHTLATRLRDGGAHALLALVVSAGPEVDAEADRLWAEGKPDESFFLDRFGAVVAEQLVRWAMVWFCRQSEPRGETVLPHLSPGCGGWDFADQARLMHVLTRGETLDRLRLLPSGMMSPKNSLLAALGVTRVAVSASAADGCRACDLTPCAFRRVPYQGVA